VAQEETPLELEIAGRTVRITHPSKLVFSRDVRVSKRELMEYYLSVAEGALNGVRDRPLVLKRFVHGAEGEAFYQKRAPEGRPSWLRTVNLAFPSGRTAQEIVVDDAAGLAFIVNLGCIELHPHAVRTGALEQPDELRIDLDPGPGVAFADVRRVALEVRALLAEVGLTGWAKTSGSRGMHVYARIAPRLGFTDVRRAALALSREIERRAPTLATSKWWKEERHGVFLDYNQNAKDRTTCSAYSVRPTPDARVSTPLAWEEVADCEPADFTVRSVPRRYAERGDPHAGMEAAVGTLDALLELAARDDAAGLGDAPWPPHFRRAAGEGVRAAPSRRKRSAGGAAGGKQGEDSTDASSAAETDGVRAPRGRRVREPLIVIARSPHKEAALAGLERWKVRHPHAAAALAPEDVLVDSMRGRSSTWTRIRVNLRHVPQPLRPAEAPDPDDDPTRRERRPPRS
jgi:DNA ligase D-like protein (predicted polymerase)